MAASDAAEAIAEGLRPATAVIDLDICTKAALLGLYADCYLGLHGDS